MQCRLISVSKPQIPECDTAEELVAYCARVSNPTNQNNKDTASKLVKYLVNNQHYSPLEMVHVVIEIETTRDIARQILRHRSFSFQEFSQRYAEVVDFAEPREARLQDRKNRQNSVVTEDRSIVPWWYSAQIVQAEESEALYREALEKGIAKEQARAVLPEGLTISRLYMAGTLRSWIHYCQLRMGNGTQKEHMEVAQACWAIIAAEFPNIADVFAPDELEELVQRFSAALLKKLKYQRDVKGYSGWDSESFEAEEIMDLIENRNENGDFIDVAAYAAFGWDKQK